jgi:(p)ppGpp synthase/HD superfamily hydrolase
MTTQSLETIREFATRAHRGQLRKYTDQPYIVHPIEVERLVTLAHGSMAMRAAALLHDVIEDTEVTSSELLAFLHRVPDVSPQEARLIHRFVIDLTDVYTKANFPELNRRQRKTLEAERLGEIDEAAKLIKFCDMYDNTRTISQDPGFAKVYLREKQMILDSMGLQDSGLIESFES